MSRRPICSHSSGTTAKASSRPILAVTAFYDWPEFGEPIGAHFDDRPWDIFDAPVIVDAPDFPAMKGFPRTFVTRAEIYRMTAFSRDRVRVLAHPHTSKVDMKNRRIHRTEGDCPLAWARNYGKGRVFYPAFGHTDEAWDDRRCRRCGSKQSNGVRNDSGQCHSAITGNSVKSWRNAVPSTSGG